MLKKVKNMLAAASLLFAFSAPAVVTTSVFAANNITDNLCTGAQGATGSTDSCTAGGGDSTNTIKNIAATVVKYLSIIVGVIAVIMIIVGGFKYITSGGDSSKVGSAKNTIIYAIIGLILVAIAQLIVNVVLGNASTLGTTTN